MALSDVQLGVAIRLVAWNANYNGKRWSFEQALALLEPLGPDLIVLSETAPPEREDPLRVHWIGSATPGLAVVARGDFELAPHPLNEGAPPLAGGFRVTGPTECNLLAVWPVQYRGGASYHSVLMATLDRYAEFLTEGPALLAGDLNSSTRVTSQKRTHPAFVARAEELGLRSVYHEHSGEAHGEEVVATYRHQHSPARPFHIDYCFATADLLPRCSLSVQAEGDWSTRSDYFSIVLEQRVCSGQ